MKSQHKIKKDEGVAKTERPEQTIIEDYENDGEGTTGFRNVCFKIFYQLF